MRPVYCASSVKALVGAMLILLFASSCSGSEYTTQHFSFPPGSKPHESSWQYMALVIVSSDESPITSKSKKVIEIKVNDRSNTVFLDDNYEFICASLRANVVWEKFEEIKVELFEVGNEYAKDLYNKQLLKSGPNRLLVATYQYDQKHNKFNRID